jgi:hypothetical protein
VASAAGGGEGLHRSAKNAKSPPKTKDKIIEINGNSNIDRMGGSIRPHKKNPKQTKITKKNENHGGGPLSKFQNNLNFKKIIMKIRGDPLPRSAGKCRK